jgi:hypothetical protein
MLLFPRSHCVSLSLQIIPLIHHGLALLGHTSLVLRSVRLSCIAASLPQVTQQLKTPGDLFRGDLADPIEDPSFKFGMACKVLQWRFKLTPCQFGQMSSRGC